MQTVDSDSYTLFVDVVGRSLRAFAREHCFAKKVLNISAFFLKSMINLLSCSYNAIQGTFLLFQNVFNIDQYCFGLSAGSNSFLDKRG